MSGAPSTTTSRRPRRGRKLISLAASVALAGSLAVATPAFADESAEANNNGGIIEAIANFFGLGKADEGVEAAAAGDESTKADGSTLTAWESHLTPNQASTQNIGRIWTDKTVAADDVQLSGGASMTVDKGNSDFVVGLSALSSMSSITNEIPKPLDIVLVLDTSSSMLSEMSGNPQYVRVNPSDVTFENGYYWVQDDNGSYRRVQQYPDRNYWYYQDASGYHYVEPTDQHPDNDYINVATFYSISNSRLAALKEAVDGFIDSTNAANQEMPDGQKHEIALITYGEDATVRNGFTEDASALKDVVNGLPANHTTRSDLGMQEAQNLLSNNGRDDSRKVVIFFTDGKPAKGGDGSFNAEVANDAIAIGSDLNSEGTLVYTVGVFEGADVNETVVDPNDETTWFNAYMNGMSSKYPFAKSYTDLGDRVGTREYYKVAEDEAGLAQVFQEIASELKTETSDSPLSSGGAGGERGYLTFTDELGKYMEVDSVKSIVFANQQFTQSSSATDGSTHTTTYVFDQEVTDSTGIFPNGNLNQILITVQKYPDDLAKGDTVTVKIPANLIPLRNYQASVNKEGAVEWRGVTKAYPVRVFYGVSLKDDAAAAVKSGTTGNAEADAALKQYIEANTSEVNGRKSVNFLSNLFEGTPDEGSGTTKATFTPAASNGYYYVQEDTPLYVYAGDEPSDVKDVDPSRLVILNKANYEQYEPKNVYYKQTVYKEGTNQAVDEIVAIPLDKFQEGVNEGMVAGGETDGAYLVKGSPRLSRITEFEDAKGELPDSNNDTHTAALAANPNWDTRAAGSGITVQLGNNGKLSVELPGELRVSKEVTVADGLDKEQFKNTGFPFEISIPSMAGKTTQAKVVATNGGAVIDGPFSFGLDENGKCTQNLKDGETLIINGLDDGAAYTVTEALSQGNGFTQSSEGATGAISSSAVAEAKFINHYAATQTTANGISAQKKFTDADTGADMAWDGATFDFVIEASTGGTDDEGNKTGSYDGEGNAITNVVDIPMPDGATNGVKHQAVSSADAFDFGSINYTKPGTYVYHVWERTPDVHASDWLAGVAYSAAVYHVQIVVKDDGQGALHIDQDASTMYKEIADNGDELTAQDKVVTAVIENTYKKDTAQAQFRATKTWNDTTGSRALADGQFSFVLEATGGTAKDGSAIDVVDVPMLTSNATVPNSGTSVSWGNIEFTNAMEGNTYTYKLYEYQPTVDGKYESAGRDNTATQNDNGEWVWRGTTYDKTVYTAEVQVSVDVENEGQPNERQHVHADITYKDAEGNVVYREDGTTLADRVPFTNTYAVTSIDGSALQVQKTLDGRAMKDGEEFTFTQKLIAGDSAGVSGLKDEATVTGDGSKTVDTSNFGVPTFTKPGTYTFQIEEQGTNGNGLTYDTHKATVTYVVNDTSKDGKIAHTGNLRVASVTYNNAAALTDADRAETDVSAFTNMYRTNLTFPGITVSKTLNGRAMVAGEFDFTITPQNQNAIDRTVASTDAQFSNTSNNASGVTENMAGKLASLKFTQADNGKDFTYIIDEVGHKDGSSEGDAPGVTYDTKRYHLTIHVSDDGNGNLAATPTIKLADADGNPTGEVVPATFVNEYVPAASNAVTPRLNKILTGRDWTDGETFAFNIEKVSAFVSGMSVDDALKIAPLPMKDGNETASITLKGSEGLAGTKSGVAVPVDFGSLTFTKAGTYVYEATEIVPSDATNEAVKDADGKLVPYAQASDEQREQTGWKKDGITYTVRPTFISVTVTDNTTEGKLEAAVTMDNGGNFRNSYAASQNFDDAVSFQLTKTLNGHRMAANQFQFNVTALDGVNANAAETAMKFGLSQDGATTSLSVPGGEGDDGQKVVMPAGGQKVSFAQADSGKTFKLQFDEAQKSATEAPGYTYDNAKYVMEATPTDLGNGTMSVATKVTKTWTDADGKEQSEVTEYAWEPGKDKATVSADFVNKYESTGTIALSGTKTIGEPWTSGPAGFEFAVEQVGDANGGAMTADTVKAVLPSPATATSDASGKFTFGDITFSKPGTYYFKVTEVDNKIPGVSYVTDGKVVTVNVAEEDANVNGNGKLIATVADDSPKLAFTNAYTQTASEPYGINITKAIAGHDAAAGQFKFQMIADEAAKAAIKSGAIAGVTVDEATGVVATESNKAVIGDKGSEDISFAGMTFTKVTEGDGYTFTVKEVVSNDDDPAIDGTQNAGWTMDAHEYKVNVKVTDVDSKLIVAATPVDGSIRTFSNTFGAATTLGANGGLQVTKQLEGRALESDQFDFTIQAKEGSENAAAAMEKIAKLNGATDGVLSFKNGAPGNNGIAVMDELGELAFDEGDIGKTFTYVVNEKTDTGLDVEGYTYDPEPEATVEITVKEGDNGKIYTETKVTKGNDVKTYGKHVEGADGEIAVVPFVNSYSATGELDGAANLAGTKVLVDGEGNAVPLNGRAWDFTLSAFDGDTQNAIDDGAVTLPGETTVQNGADGAFNFGSITFKSTGAASAIYKFKVAESGSLDGVDNDLNAERMVEVRVTDNGNGTLTAEVVGDVDLKFINQYGANSDTQFEVKGTKTLAGDFNPQPNIKEKYHFELAAESDAPLTEGDNYNADPTNPNENGTGEVTFGNLKFTMADLAGVEYGADGTRSKEFTYTVKETGEVPGVTNDANNPQTITIKLIDNGKGKLTAELVGKSFAFTNNYEPVGATFKPLEATKQLTGNREQGLQEGEFEFEATVAPANDETPADGAYFGKADDGSLIKSATAVNAAPTEGDNANVGAVTFGDITFTKPGTYTVTVTEKVPSGDKMQPFMEYNVGNNTYSYDVEVKAGGASLTAEVVKGSVSGSPQFVNNYNKPEKSVSELPEGGIQVGDELTYTIEWANTTDAAAKIVVSDELTTGLAYVDGSQKVTVDGGNAAATVAPDGFKVEGQKLSWAFDAEPNTSGTVTFKAKVTEDALTIEGSKLDNKATITVGNNPSVDTNVVPVPKPETGDLTISKTVVVPGDLGLDADAANQKDFTFTVELKDAKGAELAGEYGYEGKGGAADGAIKNGGEITLKHGQSIEIAGLPEGAHYTVTEAKADGFTSDPENGVQSGSVTTSGATAAFTNTYAVELGVLSGATNLEVTKNLTGRDWAEGDSFMFKLTPNMENEATKAAVEAGNITLPENAEGLTIGSETPGHKAAFGDITFKQAGDFQFYITEQQGDLGGVTYDTVGKLVKVHVADNGNGTLTATVVEGANPTITNKYDSEMPDGESTKTNATFSKVLEGRDWLDSDSFTFELTPKTDGAPMPKDAAGNPVSQVTVTKDNAAKFSFGEIEFTYDMVKDEPSKTKDFVYEVTEVQPGEGAIAGMTYDKHAATMTITVADNGKGELTATVNTAGGAFTNKYESSLDYGAAGGLKLTKVLTGRDMMDGQFEFTVTANGEDGLGIAGDYTAPAAKNGEKATVDLLGGEPLTFTQADAGKTFTYTVVEQPGDAEGYDYDPTTYTVTVAVADNNDGTLTVTTTVAGKGEPQVYAYTAGKTPEAAAVVPFENSYSAGPAYLGGEGDVQLEATKTLTGRDMAANEFGFTVTNVADGSQVATGSNGAAADGEASAVTFTPIEYTSMSLYEDAAAGKAQASKADATTGAIAYTYQYNVVETKGLTDGVTGVATSFAVTVKVTDNNDGTLAIEVVYPDGSDSLAFVNAYGAGAEADVAASGQKVLKAPEGTNYNAPDITGKYTFTLAGSEGAPMPEKTTTTNDAAGNVNFGTIHYTMENVFGDAGATDKPAGDVETAAEELSAGESAVPAKSDVRTKTFTYTMTEAGSVDGVTNDANATQTFTVTVTDNGDGTLTAVADPATGAKFGFTNTYATDPVTLQGDTAIQGKKTITGRPLADSEFAFRLTAVSEGAPMPEQATVTNDANGNFAFGAMTFTEPGAYQYQVSEVKGNAGGVEYDTAIYNVTVKVSDNGAGTLVAETTATKAGGDGTVAIAFTNKYEAAAGTLVLGASKTLAGAELAAGQFTFELAGSEGAPLPAQTTATNDANGQVTFPVIKFTEPGEYTYTISEVNDGQEGVTYDDDTYTVHVTVSETNATGGYDGTLHVTATYADGKAPAFANSYEPPAEPGEPGEPGTPDEPQPKPLPSPGGMVATGDSSMLLVALTAAAGSIAALVAAILGLRRTRKMR